MSTFGQPPFFFPGAPLRDLLGPPIAVSSRGPAPFLCKSFRPLSRVAVKGLSSQHCWSVIALTRVPKETMTLKVKLKL